MLVRSMQHSIPKCSCSDGLIPNNPQVPGPTHLWTRRPPAANGDYLASAVDYLPSVSRKRSLQHLLQDGRIPRNTLSSETNEHRVVEVFFSGAQGKEHEHLAGLHMPLAPAKGSIRAQGGGAVI